MQSAVGSELARALSAARKWAADRLTFSLKITECVRANYMIPTKLPTGL